MKELNFEEIKQIELSILKHIDAFCEKWNIEYSLCYGTALGARRHNGFIPWDDDIDIMMTRYNYESFVSLYKTHFSSKDKYAIVDEDNYSYNYMFAKIVDSETIIFNDKMRDSGKYGIYVDIFPIDYLSNSKEEAIRCLNRTKFLRYVLTASNWKRFFINNEYGKSRQFIRFVFFAISRIVKPKTIIKRIKSINGKYFSKIKTDYCGSAFGAYSNKDIYPSFFFDKYVDIRFNDCNFKIISSYNEYLGGIYGDFMTLPPLDKRQQKHCFKAYIK